MAAILSVIRGGQGSRQSPFHNQPPHFPNHSLTRSISSFPLQSQHPAGEKGFQLLRYPLPRYLASRFPFPLPSKQVTQIPCHSPGWI